MAAPSNCTWVADPTSPLFTSLSPQASWEICATNTGVSALQATVLNQIFWSIRSMLLERVQSISSPTSELASISQIIQKSSIHSNPRCYDLKEELRENRRYPNCARRVYIGAIRTLTVFTHFLLGLIEFQFIPFADTSFSFSS